MNYNYLITLSGVSLLGAAAGLIGTFALLRRRALTGDALAHAALPGLWLAFLVVGERSLPAMLLGALATGLLGIVVISALRRWTRIKEDAAIGIVLGVFFGAGIVLSSVIQRLPGVSRAGLDSIIFGKTASMIDEDVYLAGGLFAGTLLLVLLLFKEFKLIAFDADFARVQGWPALALDLLLMAMTAVAVIIGLPAVGVVMMAALLILPAASARFWTDDLGLTLVLAAAFGVAAGVGGIELSARVGRLPAGPSIILAGTALFVVSLLLAPKRGVIVRAFKQRKFRREILRDLELQLPPDELGREAAGGEAFL